MTFNDWETPTKRHGDIRSLAEKYHLKEVDRKSLFFYGPPGTGKTSLAKAIVSAAKAEGRPAIYRTVQDIVSRCKRCIESPEVETVEAYLNWLFSFNGLLVIDEIGRTKGGDWDKNQILFPLIDKRIDKHNIWISNYSLDELARHYDAAISSRFQTATIIGFNGIDDFRNLRR
jgi:DNA replication protein DnaC